MTGSGGRIGRSILAAMARDYRLVGFDRDGQPQPPPEVECVCVDLTEPDSVDLGMRRLRYAYGDRIASVIHLAAYHDFSGAPSPLYQEVTVEGTARLLHALRTFEVEQFVFSSTMLVHQPTAPGEPIDENAPLEALWDYPRSKIATEELLREERGDLPVVSLRIAGVYTDACESIPLAAQIGRILSDPIQGRVFPGDPTHGQAFVHMADVADAVCRCVERRASLPADDLLPILIGEPITLSYERMQRELGRLLLGEPAWPARRVPAAIAKAVTWLQRRLPCTDPLVEPAMIDRADDHYELDVSRAAELLGWKPRRSLLETLPRMVEALAADPVGWARRNDIELDAAACQRVEEASRTI